MEASWKPRASRTPARGGGIVYAPGLGARGGSAEPACDWDGPAPRAPSATAEPRIALSEA